MCNVDVRNFLFGVALVVSTSCAPSKMGIAPESTAELPRVPAQAPAKILVQADTLDLEDNDRISRVQRIARITGIAPPSIERVYAPAGSMPGVSRPVPVVRITLDEGVFFDTDSSVPLPQSFAVLSLIAENMRLDVPDAALTIIGHTDSTGTNDHNMALSARRALHVMKMLVGSGVDPLQMTTVAIGSKQPVAPNDTVEGRARNRRVEFLISASPQANLAAVQNTSVNPSNLPSGAKPQEPQPETTHVSVLQSQEVTINGDKKIGLVPLGDMEIKQSQASGVYAKPLDPPPTVSMRPAEEVNPAPLTNIIVD